MLLFVVYDKFLLLLYFPTQEHNAVRNGLWQHVETDLKAVYAFLRFKGNSVILVLVNLGSKPVDAYTLSVDEGG